MCLLGSLWCNKALEVAHVYPENEYHQSNTIKRSSVGCIPYIHHWSHKPPETQHMQHYRLSGNIASQHAPSWKDCRYSHSWYNSRRELPPNKQSSPISMICHQCLRQADEVPVPLNGVMMLILFTLWALKCLQHSNMKQNKFTLLRRSQTTLGSACGQALPKAIIPVRI